MKIRLGMIISLLIVVLAGCQQKKEVIIFIGESENWKADIEIATTHKESKIRNFTLKYQGNDANDIEDLEFKVKAPNYVWDMGNIELDNKQVFKESETEKIGGSTSDSDNLQIEVRWGEKTETFSLEFTEKTSVYMKIDQ